MNILSPKRISKWQNQVSASLSDNGIENGFLSKNKFLLITIPNYGLAINLIDIYNDLIPNELISLQQEYQLKNVKLIHLWEDVWLTRAQQIISRIKSLVGINIRLHGRKTNVKRITKPIADAFLNENHIQGAVNSRYKFGLFIKDDLIAVATFSALRKMQHSEDYHSAELIRFSVKAGFSIRGGLSKLIFAFQREVKSNDLMTYADRDWSAGEVYLRLNFEQTSILDPQYFLLDDHLKRSLKGTEHSLQPEVFNTGSLKFILKF